MTVGMYILTLLFTVGVGVAETKIFRSHCLRTGLFQASEKDRALIGHRLDTHMVKDEIDCGRRCLRRDSCISYNYEYEDNNETGHTCELSSQTKEAKPEDYEETPGFLYFGSLKESQKGVGCMQHDCYNGGQCVDTCHGDMFYCQCPKMFRGKQCERPKAHNCKELLELGDTSDGIKLIAPDDEGFAITVYCDQTNNGGGWTVLQRHKSPFTTLFRKNWADYEAGFGDLNSSFWLGNNKLSRLTKTSVHLRIDLRESGGSQGYAVYKNFSISGSKDNYRLSVGQYVEGDIGNSIHGDKNPAFVENGMQFTTSDRDNDANDYANCATAHGVSGWWFSNCGRANLNKDNIPQWDEWSHAATISYTEMKIRPA